MCLVTLYSTGPYQFELQHATVFLSREYMSPVLHFNYLPKIIQSLRGFEHKYYAFPTVLRCEEPLWGSHVAMWTQIEKFWRALLPMGSNLNSLAWHSKPSTIWFQLVIPIHLPTYCHLRLGTTSKHTTYFHTSPHITLTSTTHVYHPSSLLHLHTDRLHHLLLCLT